MMTVEHPEVGVVLPQLGGSWPDVVRVARRAEEAGFDSVWVVDHLVGFPPESGILEAWTLMSALAGATSRIGIGAQVLCQSFRSPALLAKMATTLDLVSGGRLRFLVGAGWFEPEYKAFGYRFPSAGERVAAVEDTVAICRGMFDAGTAPFSYDGLLHHVDAVRNIPPPSRRIPIGIGGVGSRMIDLVARCADEWNVPAMVLGSYARRRALLEERLAVHGRDVRRSAQIVFAPGDRPVPPLLEMFKPELGLRGSTDQMVERAGQLSAEGITGLYGFVPDEAALDDLAAVLPDVRTVFGS